MSSRTSKHHRAGKLDDKYYGITSSDVRETKMFKEFMNEVLQFVRQENSVTWRQLAERFYFDHYHLAMAIEMLDGKFVTLEKEKIPERIVAKGERRK